MEEDEEDIILRDYLDGVDCSDCVLKKEGLCEGASYSNPEGLCCSLSDGELDSTLAEYIGLEFSKQYYREKRQEEEENLKIEREEKRKLANKKARETRWASSFYREYLSDYKKTRKQYIRFQMLSYAFSTANSMMNNEEVKEMSDCKEHIEICDKIIDEINNQRKEFLKEYKLCRDDRDKVYNLREDSKARLKNAINDILKTTRGHINET